MIAGIHFQNCWFLTAEKCWFYSTAYTNKDLLIRLAFFPLFPGISGVLQFIYPRLPIACATISITTLYLYLTWVDQLISLDPLTGLNNRKQLTHTLITFQRAMKTKIRSDFIS